MPKPIFSGIESSPDEIEDKKMVLGVITFGIVGIGGIQEKQIKALNRFANKKIPEATEHVLAP